MKSITAFGFVLAGVVASVLVSGHALAASTVYGGSVCHYYYGQDASNIEFYSHGVVNTTNDKNNPKNNIPKEVICPIAKRTNDYKGITAKINLRASRPDSITCTLYSYDYDRKFLGSKAVKNKISGEQSLTIKVPSSTTRSYFSTVCLLPPKEGGEIYSIEVLN